MLRAEQVFTAARSLPPTSRGAFIHEAIADDASLRRFVIALCRYGDVADDLGHIVGQCDAAEGLRPEHYDSIPGYHVKCELNRGGSGIVYEAEQQEPKRSVAIKLLRESGRSIEGQRRFDDESELIAQLQHPYIVTIYEKNMVVIDGRERFYFAMELVHGANILTHSENAALSVERRLHLFCDVCDGVAAAHAAAIIHRDVKPENILVDAYGRPKILDFGIARLSSPMRSDAYSTADGLILGTPEYMSPEQLVGRSQLITTRSDVYSLGLVLYELVVRSRRFPPLKRSALEALEQARSWEYKSLRRQGLRIPPELDAVIGKALEREPDHRYTTAADLSKDIRDLLAHKPVSAKSASVGRRLQLLGRRRPAVAVSLVIGLLGCVGIVGALAFAASKSVETAKAERRAVRIADFQRQLLTGVDPGVAQTMDRALLRLLLDRAAKRVQTELAEDPELAAALHTMIGQTYRAAGELKDAREHLRQAWEFYSSDHGLGIGNDINTCGWDFAMCLRQLGEYGDSLAVGEAVQSRAVKAFGDGSKHWFVGQAKQAATLFENGQYTEAEAAAREAVGGLRRTVGNSDPETISAMSILGLILLNTDRVDAAKPLLEECLDASTQAVGEGAFQTLDHASNVAALRHHEGRDEEAEALYRHTLNRSNELLGPAHPKTLVTLANLIGTLEEQRRLDEIGTTVDELVRAQAEATGPLHPLSISARALQASMYSDLGRADESIRMYGAVVHDAQVVLGLDDLRTMKWESDWAIALRVAGLFDEAIAKHEDVLGRRTRLFGARSRETIESLINLAEAARSAGDLARAEVLDRQAIARSEVGLGPDSRWTRIACHNLGVGLMSQKRYGEAEPVLLRAAEIARRTLPRDHWQLAGSLRSWGNALVRLGRFTEAEAPLLEAEAALTRRFGDSHAHTRVARELLAMVYDGLGNSDEAKTWRRKAGSEPRP